MHIQKFKDVELKIINDNYIASINKNENIISFSNKNKNDFYLIFITKNEVDINLSKIIKYTLNSKVFEQLRIIELTQFLIDNFDNFKDVEYIKFLNSKYMFFINIKEFENTYKNEILHSEKNLKIEAVYDYGR